MQRWADYLDKLRDGAEVVPLRAAPVAWGCPRRAQDQFDWRA